MSARRETASRANAAKSTGPRTAEGKRRASQNSRRHGLSIPLLADPRCRKEVDELARRIAGERASAERVALARAIAEAQLDLVRIKIAKREMLKQRFGNCIVPEDRSEERLAFLSSTLTRQMSLIHRYERRALSRRKFAIRAFDKARR